MTASTSLLAWIESLFRDPAAQTALLADPQGYAADHGFQNLSSADVHDALCLAADNRSASYDHDSGNHVQLPPPPARYDHEDGAHYLRSYVSNNYTTIDEHNTNIDNSVHQQVDTHGGDFSQEIHNDPVVASGDHSVAAGGDIRDSTLTTGDRNVVGNDNQAVIAPGAKLILIASHFELAFDARYDVVLSDPTAKALIFSLGIGF